MTSPEVAEPFHGTDDPLFPWPDGTPVLGRATSFGLPPRRQCRDHIFETVGEPVPFEVPPFFLVMTRCLVCGDVLPPLEVDSFVRATPEDWVTCINAVRSEADRLNAMVVTLNDRAAGRRTVLRDFG